MTEHPIYDAKHRAHLPTDSCSRVLGYPHGSDMGPCPRPVGGKHKADLPPAVLAEHRRERDAEYWGEDR